LDAQPIDQAIQATEMLGALLAFGPDQKASAMTEDMWDAASRTAWPLVCEGNNGIRDMLVQQLKGALRQNGHPSPRNAFGMLHRWLFASRLSKDPGLIRKIVREPKLASIRSIAKAEHMHSQTLRNVLRVAGVIDDTTEALHGARNVVADYSRAKKLIELTKHAIPVSRVPDMLNTSHSLVSALIELKQLTRIEGDVDPRSKIGKAIDGRSIQRVVNFLERNFEEAETVPRGSVDLSKAAKKSRVSRNLILELLFG
jgi:hypothetical protein